MGIVSIGASIRRGLLPAVLAALAVSWVGCGDTASDDDATATATPTPTAGHLSLSPSPLQFESTEVGRSSTASLTLSNTGSGALSLTALEFPDDANGAFSLSAESADPSGTTLPGESTVVVLIQFRPTRVGDFNGTIRVVSNDSSQPKYDVPLSAKAVGGAGGDEDQDTDGYTVNQGDCDDADKDVNPAALEVCDKIDNNCDGVIDTDATDRVDYYQDVDQDGYGDSSSSLKSCTTPKGYVATAGDCDDQDGQVYPGATELCDGEDNDCDGQTDEEGSTTFYADQDGDGHGDPKASIVTCQAGSGYVSGSDDCDDTDVLTYLGADELCDGSDNDCDGQIDENAVDAASYFPDADGDGYGTGSGAASCQPISGQATRGGDCDDTDAAVHPGTGESCNGKDDDCDGQVDNGGAAPPEGATLWYPDADADGHGASSPTQRACTRPAGYVAAGDDCDDAADNVYPGAIEACDGIDNNCNGQIDEAGSSTVYVDADNDGYGDSSQPSQGCGALSSGFAARGGDCDDHNASINPGATELCDGIDQDCDSQIDDGVETTWYVDGDGDGYGDPGKSVVACSSPGSSYSAQGGDCDDANKNVHPGALEVCEAEGSVPLDNDCDGTVDNASSGLSAFYLDADADGYGDKAQTTQACTAPTGYLANSTDCNDLDRSIHPGASEYCNSIDDDCDGQIDETALDARVFYLDADKDGYGGLVSATGCTAPAGYVAKGGDCNDSSSSINPGAVELCNGVDDDCDTTIDEGVTSTYYLDRDGDKYGDDSTTVQACASPGSTYVSVGGDCDDLNKAINPGASELCNGIDDNCNAKIDDNPGNGTTYYKDGDGDRYGDSKSPLKACSPQSGYVTDSTDCNDGSAAIYPGAVEVCDGVDQNCNGVIDDNPTSTPTYYPDQDGDGYGSTVGGITACSRPTGYLSQSGDCNDSNPAVNPGAAEVCDAIDNNCDAQIDEGVKKTYYIDRDTDGYGDSSGSTQACSSPSAFHVDRGGDCNDFDATIYPTAPEKCDGKDNNCDGSIDPSSSVDAPTWYADTDKDGYGSPSVTTKACSQPAGYVAVNTDCNDSSAQAYPGAPEKCDSLDNDCDGVVDPNTSVDAKTWYQDADADTYGSKLVSKTACAQPAGYVADNTDCNDTDSAVSPGATELCNTRDDNCNGQVDETTAADAKSWYLDGDKDGYGNASKLQKACSQPAGYVADKTDCDDSDATVYPGAEEKPSDLKDNDCDGKTDESGSLASLTNGGLTGHSVVYDPVRQRVLVFGGEGYYELSNTVYSLDLSGGNKGAWIALNPTGTPPPPLYQHTAVYDLEQDRMVVFGGSTYQDLSNTVYALGFDLSEGGIWSKLTPTGTAPTARAAHTAVYDPIDSRMVLFGGSSWYDLSPEVWSLDLNTTQGAWTLLNAGLVAGGPGPRQGSSLVYDSKRDRFLMVGGDGYYNRYADVWVLDTTLAGWTSLSPSNASALPPVASATASFYETGNALLVFGGEQFYDLGATMLALDLSSSPDGTWKTLTSKISTPVPGAGGGGVVLESEALDTIYFGSGYYGLLDTPVSINLK